MGNDTVTIVGLGYVGLPLACICAKNGFQVKGLDLNEEKVKLVNQGKSPIKDSFVEACLGKFKGEIKAFTNPAEALEKAETIIVCVPTPALAKKPDLSFVEAACREIAPFISKNCLVIIESTVYPGTVEEIVKPILEQGSKLKAGKDFFLGHCPERIDPGNKIFTIGKIPRVLSCLSKKGNEKAKKFYSKIIDADILILNSVKAAEAVKVMENTFRDVNIAFVNELAKSFDTMGIDLSEVIKGASTKPFGFMPFYPGPGVGGHCIAQDPYYLIARAEKAGFEHKFLRLARKINESMPEYATKRALDALDELGIDFKKAKIALLGIAYKPDVDDARESPGLKIVALLREKGCEVKVFDPWIKEKSNVESLEQAVEKTDLVILATHHSQFVEKLKPAFLKKAGVKAVIDTRNALDEKGIGTEGILYKGIGK